MALKDKWKHILKKMAVSFSDEDDEIVLAEKVLQAQKDENKKIAAAAEELKKIPAVKKVVPTAQQMEAIKAWKC